jgi:hypothetical protein
MLLGREHEEGKEEREERAGNVQQRNILRKQVNKQSKTVV